MQLYDRNIPYNDLPELPPPDDKVITIEILQALNKANKALDSNIKSLNTAKKYLGQLQELGIMIPKKIGKEIVYLNIDLYNLLSGT